MPAVTPLGVSVLALLSERPMHPYEMYRLLLERHADRIVKVRPGSLYHTVDRLAEQELVEATGTDRAGGRPERTTYRITPAGREALAERIRALLATPVNEYPQFPVALAEAHNLPRAEVIDLLTTRADRLEAAVTEIAGLLAAARERSVAEAYVLAGRYAHDMHAAELGWLRRLIDRLERKELPWPPYDNP
ncbi:PadR family transcriptional regulator [Pseudonocardia nigra]|uniref:PadR family transcriptional regulator n=1 Tax=Pseudonocardia nigra TaxID=1921578 RepID=UPI0027E21BD0|nr:PadR family transcriptional regulator [Pseudonocardia nigra]